MSAIDDTTVPPKPGMDRRRFLAFTGMAVAMFNAAYPAVPLPFLILAALAIGVLLGSINGLLVWKLDIPPIVVHLIELPVSMTTTRSRKR